jgi:hypothetical protein
MRASKSWFSTACLATLAGLSGACGAAAHPPPPTFSGECRTAEAHVKRLLDGAMAAEQQRPESAVADYDAVVVDASRFLGNCEKFASPWPTLHAITAINGLERLARTRTVAAKALGHRRDELAETVVRLNNGVHADLFLATVDATNAWAILRDVLGRLRRKGTDTDTVRLALISGAASYPSFRRQDGLLLAEHRTLETRLDNDAFIAESERKEARRIAAILYRGLLHEGRIAQAQEVAAQMLAFDATPAAYEVLGEAAMSIGGGDQVDWLRRDAAQRLPSQEGGAASDRPDALAPP